MTGFAKRSAVGIAFAAVMIVVWRIAGFEYAVVGFASVAAVDNMVLEKKLDRLLDKRGGDGGDEENRDFRNCG